MGPGCAGAAAACAWLSADSQRGDRVSVSVFVFVFVCMRRPHFKNSRPGLRKSGLARWQRGHLILLSFSTASPVKWGQSSYLLRGAVVRMRRLCVQNFGLVPGKQEVPFNFFN